MLLVHEIRENKDAYVAALAKRGLQVEQQLDEIIRVDETRRKTQASLDEILAKSNSYSREIGELYKSGQADKAEAMKQEAGKFREESRALQEKLDNTVTKLNELLYEIPNVPHESVPAGASEDDNEEVFREGDVPELFDGALPHWELAKKYDLIDFQLGAKITGAGFPVFKGKGARLQRALIAYFLDKNTEAGYEEYQVPLLVNEASAYGTGQLPDKEGQMYHVTGDNLYLIPTSEVPITNIFRDVILDHNELPKACTGYTPNFRREAGSYGAHVRGLNRLHQFDKVELVRIEHPDNSYAALDGMVEHVKDILRELKLPYRVLRLCGGDLGFTSALTFDFEVYSTAQEKWLEISSCSNFETYQSNRVKVRFRDKDGKNKLAHTLNGSSLAVTSAMSGIIDKYETKYGITIPEALVPYCGFHMIG